MKNDAAYSLLGRFQVVRKTFFLPLKNDVSELFTDKTAAF